MSGLFGGSAPSVSVPSSPPLPPAPKSQEQTVENAASAEKIRLMRAMGRQSTILSQPVSGTSDTEKTHFGG